MICHKNQLLLPDRDVQCWNTCELPFLSDHEMLMQTLEYIRRRNDIDITGFMLDDSVLLSDCPEKEEVTEKVKKVKVV